MVRCNPGRPKTLPALEVSGTKPKGPVKVSTGGEECRCMPGASWGPITTKATLNDTDNVIRVEFGRKAEKVALAA